MAEKWPASINELLLQAQFKSEDDSHFIEQSMDVGPPKVRRRTTKAYTTQTCSIFVDQTQLATLKTFYDVTLAGGVSYFDFDDPLTGSPSVYRFKSPYVVTPISGSYYSISMIWIKQP